MLQWRPELVVLHRLMMTELTRVTPGLPQPVAGTPPLAVIIEIYVAFARDHPAHVHLMLRGELERVAYIRIQVMPRTRRWR